MVRAIGLVHTQAEGRSPGRATRDSYEGAAVGAGSLPGEAPRLGEPHARPHGGAEVAGRGVGRCGVARASAWALGGSNPPDRVELFVTLARKKQEQRSGWGQKNLTDKRALWPNDPVRLGS